MKRKSLWLVISNVVVLMMAVGAGAAARAENPFFQLTGVINGYSPASVSPAGPWEIRGNWTLNLNPFTGTADFTADLTMVRSDYWVIASKDNPDLTGDRMSHAHHITLKHVKISAIQSGFELAGPATVTKNGDPGPFTSAQLKVDFTGGVSVPISNVTLTFVAPNPDPGTAANSHFGSLPILGVVNRP